MRYQFGDCVLCPETFTLEVAGEPRPVEPQVFDLLHLLISRAGDLVTHDDLIAKVWGGRIVSDAAISSRISAARAAIGDDGTRQVWIRTVPRRGFRFVGEARAQGPRPPAAATAHQTIGFCHSADGTRIAWARSGSGPPLLRAGHWLTHLEHDWQSPVWRPLLEEFSQHFTLWRYDQRGNGLSDRRPEDLSLGAMVDDLTAVTDAAGLDGFTLYGTSQGVPIAIEYVLRHPGRVSRLILHGGFERGRALRDSDGGAAMSEALVTLIREGWGRPGSAFVRAFVEIFIPDGTKAQIDSLADLQRLCTDAEMAARLRRATDHFSVAGRLSGVRVPTLVLHARADAVHPLEQGLTLAARIPGAEFVQLDSANHVILPQEPAWEVLFAAIHRAVEAEDRSD
ncbi:alpha/beta fold hydrolase [Pararhodobacter sp. SW119]|uniref:alpha/beta fold hydrolase n=1 Tax=Pararhodobacter sp. SW119 TaxID=2780075 RepID=UPI001AE0ABC4|nr:alpha/beta fold hydrolase [Pararhodobacter sp. SW119]